MGSCLQAWITTPEQLLCVCSAVRTKSSAPNEINSALVDASSPQQSDATALQPACCTSLQFPCALIPATTPLGAPRVHAALLLEGWLDKLAITLQPFVAAPADAHPLVTRSATIRLSPIKIASLEQPPAESSRRGSGAPTAVAASSFSSVPPSEWGPGAEQGGGCSSQ